MKDFEISIGQGRLLLIREYGVTGVVELRILGREEDGEREELFDIPLKDEYAMQAALALVEAAGLLPDLDDHGSVSDSWLEIYEAKNWDTPRPRTNILRSLGWYRHQLDAHEAERQAHTEKIMSDARALYNMQRSASDLIWEDLKQMGQVRWTEIALLAEKLNTPQ